MNLCRDLITFSYVHQYVEEENAMQACSLSWFSRQEVVSEGLPIAFPVGLIVLVVIRDQVGQGEAVMGGDEVDAVLRPAAAAPLPAAIVAPPVICQENAPNCNENLRVTGNMLLSIR